MPTEAIHAQSTTTHPVATRRILRLALGTSLCLLFSQVITWPLSFIAPVLALTLLGLPLPAPGLKKSIVFAIAMMAPLIGGLAMVPMLHHARSAGILLVALALFHSFYYTARGGNPALGMVMTVGLTLVVTIGSVNGEVMLLLIESLAISVTAALVFVAIAHGVVPDLPADPSSARPKKPPPPVAGTARAGLNALRAMLVVFPLALIFMFMSASPSYTVVMIKVATMGQQASAAKSREMGRTMLESTLWGGLGAMVAWMILKIYPTLPIYVLLVALAGLVYGRFIFRGTTVHPKFQMVSYAYLTMIVILAPAVLDGPGSSGADGAIWSRLMLFVLITVYGTLAVWVFDAFWPGRNALAEQPQKTAKNAEK